MIRRLICHLKFTQILPKIWLTILNDNYIIAKDFVAREQIYGFAKRGTDRKNINFQEVTCMDSCDSAGRKNKTDGFWDVLAQGRTCMDAISSDNRSGVRPVLRRYCVYLNENKKS